MRSTHAYTVDYYFYYFNCIFHDGINWFFDREFGITLRNTHIKFWKCLWFNSRKKCVYHNGISHGQIGDDCWAGSIVNITGMKLHNIILPFIRFECETRQHTHIHMPQCYDILRKNYAMLRKRLVKCKRINCQVLKW